MSPGETPDLERITAVPRRTALKAGAATLTGSGLLTTSAAAQDTDELDVHTGDVQVVSKNSVKAKGKVTGMKQAGCRRLKVGCEHRYKDDKNWHRSFYGTVTATYSVTFILTLTNLNPDKTHECRIICKPVTVPEVCTGNIVQFSFHGKQDKHKKKEKKEQHHKKQKHGKNENPAKKAKKYQRHQCSCGHHPNDRRTHITFCPGAATKRHTYTLKVSGSLSASPWSCSPDAFPHRHVSTESRYVSGGFVNDWVQDTGHSYLFTGSVTDLELDSSVTVYVNGHKL